MKNKKIFVLSWFYPPINSSESFVTYKLLSHSGFEYDVWTREGSDDSIWDRKVKDEELKSPNVKVITGSSNMGQWIEDAYNYFVQHKNEYSAVMTRSMPPEAHLVGERIKKNFADIKWVASYGDPLVGTPYLNVGKNRNPYLLRKYIEEESPSKLRTIRIALSPMRNAQKMIWNKLQKKLGASTNYTKINDVTLKGADVVIVNNQYQLKHIFSGRYKELINKGLIIPHSFDSTMYDNVKKGKNQKIIFSYTGHLDDIRNARVLLQALNDLLHRDKDLSDKIEVNFYGHLSDKDKLYIVDNGLTDIVRLRGDISYIKSLKIMKESNWLLLFDANFSEEMDENIYLPAKLIDYIGASTSILAITQAVGASADIVRQVGNGIVCTHSKDEVLMYLAKIIYQQYKPEKINEDERKKFEAAFVAKRLDIYLGELLK